MSKVLKCQMCHLMANVKCFGNFSQFLAFLGQLLPSFQEFFTTVGNFCHLLANFAIFLHPLGIFHNFWQILPSFGNLFASFGNFCHVLTAFDNFWQICPFLATVGNFKHFWADFGFFLATFGCSHKLLATFMNFLSH